MKLFFDTETTGVPIDYKAPMWKLDNWPKLVQLGWIVVDDGGTERGCGQVLIKQLEPIPDVAIEVHGITTEAANESGIYIGSALTFFGALVADAESLVGHNVIFDVNVMGAESLRLGLPVFTDGKAIVDTMLRGTQFCAIPNAWGTGFKWPKLKELYFALFGRELVQEHTALSDIRTTAQCYFKMRELGLIAQLQPKLI